MVLNFAIRYVTMLHHVLGKPTKILHVKVDFRGLTVKYQNKQIAFMNIPSSSKMPLQA